MNGSHKAPKTKNPTSNPIRVLHLIDSLALGGAERMAVNLCNVLAESGCEMHLCATRLSGPMQEFISPNVRFLELNKKRTFDLAAILRLWSYIRQHGIQVIHAHSSSFFMGCLMKWMTGARLVWHDHNGKRVELLDSNRKLRLFSSAFDAVMCVNETLRQWAANHLFVDPAFITYLPNFPSLEYSSNPLKEALPGCKERRIICTANLRFPKDHSTLVAAMRNVCDQFPNAQLFLVGADDNDDYSIALKSQIQEMGLDENMHILGQRPDISDILKECSIGVLSSESEGLPVSLLEYGLAGLAVACTDVGECATVLGDGEYGKVVPAKNPEALASALLELLSNISEREVLGNRFHKHVEQNYSGHAIALDVRRIYSKVLFDA